MRKNSIFNIIFTSLILISNGAQAQEVFYREGLLTKSFTVKVPTTGDGTPADMFVVRRQNGEFMETSIATGKAVPKQKTDTYNTQLIQPKPLKFSDLEFIVDGSGKKIAALYPISENKNLSVTALHALQNTRFENVLLNEKQLWGLQNQTDGKLLDIALISEIRDEDQLKAALSKIIDSEDTINTGVVDHLNVVDQGELMLSRSQVQITSSNQNYVFFKNTSQSMIGYASSGAVIFNTKNGNASSIITCASKITLNRDESVLRNRALKLSSLLKYKLVELTPELINGFEKLPCDPQDSRGAGGP